jgi:L-cysteine desulfidase
MGIFSPLLGLRFSHTNIKYLLQSESQSLALGRTIGDVSGMICEGASNNCAMKVSTSVSSARKAVMMELDDSAVIGNEGLWRVRRSAFPSPTGRGLG